MAGREVTRRDLDVTMANNIVAARDAIQGLETVNAFLALNPIGADGVDPLTISTTPTNPSDPTSAPGKFGYTAEEAALIRDVFGKLASLKPSIDPVFEQAQALTGLL